MVYLNPIVGRTGLGNMLFCWARAEVVALKTGAKILNPQWTNFNRIGTWLRGERDKRYYFRIFNSEGMTSGIKRRWLLMTRPHRPENGIEHLENETVYDFRGMAGFFNPFLGEQKYVRDRLWSITSQNIKSSLAKLDGAPFVGAHIRRGDFSSTNQAVRDDWYVRAIKAALKEETEVRHIRIFSDAKPEDLRGICSEFPGYDVIVMPMASAIHDIWGLAKSKRLVATLNSSFSMWATFLGQMPSYWSSAKGTIPAMYVDEALKPIVLD